ncbi:pH-response regulator protein palA/RIM20 [Mycena indigotica]|uniref:pH-response regulator protein palA/RIM20 n=1 Tax=Mycena indigotica TaxID=2126181 RepID=A0A8H6WB62_9AGAR|nr:pH-response regulator protein palA/RIM20 [Mycena indigotica]KAF7312299.1 pH-response regulator protein palA/RIM20 [Mycena indigotica]
MSNLLTIPFKKSYALDIKEPVRNYLLHHNAAHPDAFRDDIARWQSLRNQTLGGTVHVDRVNAALSYHAQLLSIISKLPQDIGLEIAYAHVFSPSSVPVTLRNLSFERAAVIFNLAALYSQLAASEDRSNSDGIKRAIPYYQQAAGTFNYLRTSVLPKVAFSEDDEENPLDLSLPFVHGLEWLMLAQAQECWWQNAKLSKQLQESTFGQARSPRCAATLYQSAIETIHAASPPITPLFPNGWLAHIDAKRYHFEAVAQYRQSLAELEGSHYGAEIARLDLARSASKKAYEGARRGKVAPAVVQDVQSLLDSLQKDFARAERDNYLIYHDDVPAASALPLISPSDIAKPTVVPGLSNPDSLIGREGPLFADLIGWGARAAIDIYNDRKSHLVQDRISEAAQRLKDTADENLREQNLPSALEALERSSGLPPSLLQKAEQVRREEGPARIEAALADRDRLARQDAVIISEAMDILDNEASEDEAVRSDPSYNRAPSYEANVELVEKERRFRDILARAAESDETVQQKWDDWEASIILLAGEESELEAVVPSTTISSSQDTESSKHARLLRVALEALDTLHRNLQDFVRRAQSLEAADDIHSRIVSAASGLERLAEVKPEIFEDVMDEELAKYDKFLDEVAKAESKQNELLADIKRYNDLFVQSRREDSSVKAREEALRSLEQSFQKYREIVKNLNEGIQFYNNLAQLFHEFKEECKVWALYRNSELHSLVRSMEAVTVKDQPSNQLPPMSDWGFEEVQLPPPPPRR